MSLEKRIQTALNAFYPPRCVGCGELVLTNYGLCGPCWSKTPFIGGTVCDACGVPLPGADTDEQAHCDECLYQPRPWERARAALIYEGQARRLVLGLKHGDRHDIFRPAAAWMLQAGQPLLQDPTALLVPVPLHWMRLLKRRYNQSALLAQALSRLTDLAYAPDILVRPRRTEVLDGKTRVARQDTLQGAISVHARRRHRVAARRIVLIDDVMTSGATLEAATLACYEAGADHVDVLVLARVVKGD